MDWKVKPIAPGELSRYATVPMAIIVRSMLRPSPLLNGLGGIALKEVPVAEPYVKDYDDLGAPTDWAERFDLSGWRIAVVEDGETVLGGAAAFGAEGPVAELWDIRVQPRAQGTGIGRALFEYQREWARGRGYTWLKAETQNVNVGACRFYRRQGGLLGTIDRFAYAGQPAVEHEVMLVWYFPLTSRPGAGGA